MTDMLSRPAEAEPVPLEDRAPVTAWAGAVASLRWCLAGLLVGAGAIHLAMTPSHFGESAVEGVGFLASAWIQLALAGVVLVRPTRRALVAVAAANVVFVAVWLVSRTTGLPFGANPGSAEPITFVDGVCVVLETIGALMAAGLAMSIPATSAGDRHRSDRSVSRSTTVVALAGALAAIALATGAIASPAARDHAAGHGDSVEVAGATDHSSMDHGSTGAANQHSGTADDRGFSALANGTMGGEHHTSGTERLTAEERVLLARQLASTTPLIEAYPTLGAAEAAGWRRQGPFAPGLGVHYTAPANLAANMTVGGGPMDSASMPTPMLIFDGLTPDAPLAGFMYLAFGIKDAPEGFAGPNDHWHYHENVCVKMVDGVLTAPFGGDQKGVTEKMCTDIGGRWVAESGYMVHVWNVPGYESSDGMFSGLNRRITCPDGTYDQVDQKELGSRASACKDA
jgi:hypothetical protein